MRSILKAGLKVGLATLSSLLGWVVAGKILALTMGAAGVGLFGLLRQLLQNLTLIGSFNGQTALVQGIASRSERADQIRYSGSVLGIMGLIAAVFATGLLLGAPWVGPWLIPHPQAVALLRWLALAMLVLVAQTYVVSLLNGHRMINDLVKAQVLGPVFVLVLVYPMVWLVQGGHGFGFIMMLAGPAMAVTLAGVWAARRGGWIPALRVRIHRPDGVSFFRISAVLLATGILTTGTQFFQSWFVARHMGLAEAGHFWTAWTLSMSYVTLVLGSLGIYYMPSLSRLTGPEERRALIRDYLRLALIAMPLLVSLVILCKPWVIQGMFSPALLPALKIMRWMLIGDFFKGISWVLAFPMLAFSDMKWFFWSETLFNVGLALFAWAWLSTGGGTEGLGALFGGLYIVYLGTMVYYIRSRHGFTWMAREIAFFLGGLALILLMSALTWRDLGVRGWPAGLLILLGGCHLALTVPGSAWHFLLKKKGKR